MHTTRKENQEGRTAKAAAAIAILSRKQWPTPNTPSGGGNLMSTPNHTGGIDLEGAAELWQTPSVADVTGGYLTRGGERSGELLLNGQAAKGQWGTPTTRDHKDGGGNDGEHASKRASRPPGALFPPGPADRDTWRDIIRERPDLAPAIEYEVRGVAARLTRGLDFARPDQLRGLGNMVVPQQGALAFLVLLGAATE